MAMVAKKEDEGIVKLEINALNSLKIFFEIFPRPSKRCLQKPTFDLYVLNHEEKVLSAMKNPLKSSWPSSVSQIKLNFGFPARGILFSFV